MTYLDQHAAEVEAHRRALAFDSQDVTKHRERNFHLLNQEPGQYDGVREALNAKRARQKPGPKKDWLCWLLVLLAALALTYALFIPGAQLLWEAWQRGGR